MASSPEPAQGATASIRHWSDLAELARFAVERHGFGNSDNGFGITYPEDLDDHDRVIEKMEIPAGCVLAYGFWGPEKGGYEVLVPENLYLSVLAGLLESAVLAKEAAIVRSLAEDRRA